MWIRVLAAVVVLVTICSFVVPPANAKKAPASPITARFQQGRIQNGTVVEIFREWGD